MSNNDFRAAKRAHSPDGNEQSFGRHPSYRGGPQQHWNKRHRGEHHNQPLTIEEKIARLGDTGSRSIDIGMLAKEIDADLMSKVGEEEKIKNVTSKICRCIVAFPSRVATYATLIGLISVKHYNVSCQIINTLHASYPVYLEAQRWQEALTIIHLLSSLVNCKVIRPSALLSQFELLLEITLEDNIPQTRSDYYVYTVLSSLPLVALELSLQTDQQSNFDQLLNTIETYLSKRDKKHVDVIRVWKSDDSTVQMDYLDSLWVQTKNFKSNNWNETFLLRPYNDKEYKDIMASSLIPQNSPTIQIPAHSPDYHYPVPRIVLRLFEDDVAEGHRSIPGSDKIERFCIENHIRNLIDEIPNETRDCARHISHIPHFDQLPMKHILIETLLGELFVLPKSKHREILYHALLYELTKIFHPSQNPDEIKFNYDSILNEAVKVLYQNLNTMNMTCYTRFIEWFSFHLNNTEYLFPWQSWSDATTMEAHIKKKSFVHEILDRCVRFSFHKKISTMVSGVLDSLMPAEVKFEKKSHYADKPKYADMFALLDLKIDKLITERADAKTICETLNIRIDGVELPSDFVLVKEKHSYQLLKIDAFTSQILSKASKSLTHLSSAIGKYKNVFKALVQVKDGQEQLLTTIWCSLYQNPQLFVILVDKLLKADLIGATEVCDWVFTLQHDKTFTWDILNNTIDRVARVIQRLTKEKQEKDKPPAKDEKSEEEAGSAQDIEMKTEPSENLDEKITEATKACKDLIIGVFHKFIENIRQVQLSSRVCGLEEGNTMYQDMWIALAGQMQRVYYNHYEITQKLHDDLMPELKGAPDTIEWIVNFNQ